MKKTILLCVIMLLGILLCACSSSTSKELDTSAEISVIENITQYSRLSTEELKDLIGEPASEEVWTNSTSKGDFEITTLSYDINSNHYEFLIADNSVVRLSIYSEKYWNNSGEAFSYNDKSDFSAMFNVEITDSTRQKTDNGITYTLSPVNDNVAMFDIQNINETEKTFDFVKVTYNLNYFD